MATPSQRSRANSSRGCRKLSVRRTSSGRVIPKLSRASPILPVCACALVDNAAEVTAAGSSETDAIFKTHATFAKRPMSRRFGLREWKLRKNMAEDPTSHLPAKTHNIVTSVKVGGVGARLHEYVRSSAMTLPSFGRLPGRDEVDGALELRDRRAASPRPIPQGRRRRRAVSAAQGHRVAFRPRRRTTRRRLAELGMALGDLRHLLGAHEHALDLRGLVRAAHPAFDAHVGAPARAASRHERP